jgi:hypothetical protein
MRRLTAESLTAASEASESLARGPGGEEGGAREGGATSSRERPPNPDPTKWSPDARGAGGGAATPAVQAPQSVRMGNSPPKHGAIKTPATHTRLSVPSLNLPRARQDPAVSSPRLGPANVPHVSLSRPDSGLTFQVILKPFRGFSSLLGSGRESACSAGRSQQATHRPPCAPLRGSLPQYAEDHVCVTEGLLVLEVPTQGPSWEYLKSQFSRDLVKVWR